MRNDASKLELCGGNLVLTDIGILPVSMVSKENALLSIRGERIPVISNTSLAAKSGRKGVSTVSFDKGAFDQECPRQSVAIPAQQTVKFAGALVTAAQVVNGATVTNDRMDAVNVYTLELAIPGEIEVSGLTVVAQHAGIDSAPAVAVQNVRQHFLRYALQNGWQYTEDPSVQISVENSIVRSISNNNIFEIQKPHSVFQIHSRSAVVAEQNPESDDQRRLGVLITAIHADGKNVPIDSDYFRTGFHGLERSGKQLFRWSDGNSTLKLPFAVGNLRITVGCGLRILEKIS
jgi:hypothetical protein